MLSYGGKAVNGRSEGGDREAQGFRIHPGSASRPDYLCTKTEAPMELWLNKTDGLFCSVGPTKQTVCFVGGFEMGFKIKRPDYGSGQLERDLIFLRLKDLFDISYRARAMPLKKAKPC
jgi:hypothetical protein